MDFVRLQAFAPSTRRTRQSQWNQYFKFCELTRLEPFPVLPSNVSRFLVHVSEQVSFTTLNNYVSALNALLRPRSDFTDLRQDYGLILVLRGLRCIKGDATEPMDPLLPSDLLKIHQVVNHSDSLEHLVWIIVVLAFRTLLRKSHFVLDHNDTRLHQSKGPQLHGLGLHRLNFFLKDYTIQGTQLQDPLMPNRGTSLCSDFITGLLVPVSSLSRGLCVLSSQQWLTKPGTLQQSFKAFTVLVYISRHCKESWVSFPTQGMCHVHAQTSNTLDFDPTGRGLAKSLRLEVSIL